VQGDLSRAAPGQASKDLAAGLVPLGQLLRGDGVGVLAGVEALEQSRALDVAAADIEGPADEGTVLVGVQDDPGGGVQGDALLEFLGGGC
jgi:hypothetical protein